MARKKTATRKASALPQGNDIPEGMQRIGSGNAPTWAPEVGDALHGTITDAVKTVEFEQKRKVNGKMTTEKVERRVMEVTDQDGERHAVWESAALGELFDAAVESGPGLVIYVRFDGLGKKKPGQNAPKLFTVAIAA